MADNNPVQIKLSAASGSSIGATKRSQEDEHYHPPFSGK